ncbi:hypothetical protein HYX07_02795 [Candidatus Woesearchaeota archaeon]|nr:hypothetical protein [Candidatus Woesearchaeota archaeon]
MNLKLKDIHVFALVAALPILIFSYILFGMTGIRVALGIVFVSLPFYILLNKLELEEGEKFVFSALLGLTIFPSLVYILGFLISFRLAIAAAFIVFVGIAIAVIKYNNSKKVT